VTVVVIMVPKIITNEASLRVELQLVLKGEEQV
jgi:hypothetical protein